MIVFCIVYTNPEVSFGDDIFFPYQYFDVVLSPNADGGSANIIFDILCKPDMLKQSLR